MKSLRSIVRFAALASLVLATGWSGAAAAPLSTTASVPPPIEDPPRIIVSDEQARADDVAAVRKSDPSRTEAEIWDDQETILALGDLGERLKGEYPDIYSHLEIVNGEAPADAILHLTGPAPEPLLALVASLPVTVEIRLDRALAANEIQDLTNRVSDVVYDLPVFDSGMIIYDLEAEVLRVTFSNKPQVDAGLALKTVTAAAQVAAAGVKVDVQLDPEAVVKPELISGGTSLGQADGPNQFALACTMAFSGTRGASRGGITARHCLNGKAWTRMTYENRYTLAPGVIASFDQGDAQYHYANDSVNPQYIYNRSATGTLLLRNLNSIGVPNYMQDICGYGGATQRQYCSKVTGYDGSWAGTGERYYNLIQLSGHLTQFGDSGGPWFYIGVGYGVHSAGGGREDTGSMLIAPITDVAASMGVTVVTAQ